MNKKWTESEKQVVLANYNNSTDFELCQLVRAVGNGHSLASVRKFRQRLNLKKAKGRPSKVKIQGQSNVPSNPTEVKVGE